MIVPFTLALGPMASQDQAVEMLWADKKPDRAWFATDDNRLRFGGNRKYFDAFTPVKINCKSRQGCLVRIMISTQYSLF